MCLAVALDLFGRRVVGRATGICGCIPDDSHGATRMPETCSEACTNCTLAAF